MYSTTITALLIFSIFGIPCVEERERIEWNNGICSISGIPWQYIDKDLCGVRFYIDGKGNYTCIFYNVDNTD